MNDHGNVVCAYNRTPDKVTNFLENEAKNTNVSLSIINFMKMFNCQKDENRK